MKTNPLKTVFAAALFAATICLTTPAIAGSFLTGSGAPAVGLGANDDVYLRTDNGTLYKKSAGTWSTLISRLAVKGDKGDTGATGGRGVAGPIGPAGPGLRTFPNNTTFTAASPEYVGQLALRTDTNALYRGTGTTVNAWTLIPTQGAQGEPGEPGLIPIPLKADSDIATTSTATFATTTLEGGTYLILIDATLHLAPGSSQSGTTAIKLIGPPSAHVYYLSGDGTYHGDADHFNDSLVKIMTLPAGDYSGTITSTSGDNAGIKANSGFSFIKLY